MSSRRRKTQASFPKLKLKLRCLNLWLILPALAVCASCQSGFRKSPAQLTRFEYQRPEMGVPFRIVLYAPDRSTADAAANAAFQRIEQLNSIMSDYDADSELSQLSRSSGQRKEIRVSDDLWFVLKRSQELAERSGGAFDITVGPFVNLWRRARRQHQLPEPSRLAQARAAVGYWHMRLDHKQQSIRVL